jgi:hypothetical protein
MYKNLMDFLKFQSNSSYWNLQKNDINIFKF